MNTLTRTLPLRLTAATMAAATTFALFSAVVDISEPERGTMIAAAAARRAVQAGAVASTPVAVAGFVAGDATTTPAR